MRTTRRDTRERVGGARADGDLRELTVSSDQKCWSEVEPGEGTVPVRELTVNSDQKLWSIVEPGEGTVRELTVNSDLNLFGGEGGLFF
jgi:hypothetical protein